MVFDNHRVMEQNCHDDVIVLREACQYSEATSRRIGNTDVFSRRSRSPPHAIFYLNDFLMSETIGLITADGYSCNK